MQSRVRFWKALSLFPSIELVEAIVHVTQVEWLGGHRLLMEFDDGTSGEADFSDEVWSGVLAPLADPEYFGQVRLDEELGTIVWPNGADFAPETLHQLATG